jgi:hypothetical protein
MTRLTRGVAPVVIRADATAQLLVRRTVWNADHVPRLILIVLLLLVTAAPAARAQLPLPVRDPVVVAAGDVACDPTWEFFNDGEGDATHCRQARTAQTVMDADPDAVFVLGDAQYEDSLLWKFQRSYDPTWGRFKAITRPGDRQPRVLLRRRRPATSTTSTGRALQRPGGRPRQGLLQLRRRHLARDRAELGLLADRRLRLRLGAGAVAARRPGRAPALSARW